LRRRPCGSFVAGVLQTAHVPGPRPGCSRGLAGAAFASPAASVGFADPSQCLPDPAGECASSASRAHLPFHLAVHREFHRRGTPLFRAGRRTARPRLLGFGPGGQSRRVAVATPPWLCEQGRPGAAAWTALGFMVLSQVFGRRPLGIRFRNPAARGVFASRRRDVICRCDRSTSRRRAFPSAL
jgi:hypothetical protein